MTLNPQFLADKKGKKVAVQLSVKEYEYLIEELEMKEDIELYKKVAARKQLNTLPVFIHNKIIEDITSLS